MQNSARNDSVDYQKNNVARPKTGQMQQQRSVIKRVINNQQLVSTKLLSKQIGQQRDIYQIFNAGMSPHRQSIDNANR